MENWKVKKKADTPKGSGKAGRRALGIFLLLATLGIAVYDFPAVWNQAFGQSIGTIQEEEFKLGLDLQGGAHLVYEANMSEIPSDDRLEALEGVKDVIERRVNAFGVSEPVVQTSIKGDSHRVVIELAGVLDVSEAISLIGETPILEFKEPGIEPDRELSEEENAQVGEAQVAEREAAQDVLNRARAGENFNALVSEFSIDPRKEDTQGVIDGIGTIGIYAPIGEAIEASNVYNGLILPELIETVEGLNIVKYQGEKETQEWLLSHVFVCFEGTPNCANPVPEIEASLRLNNAKEQVTVDNFADIARQFGNDPRDEEGDLGWVIPGDSDPIFDAVVAGLAVGEISDVFVSSEGYHMVYKRDERRVNTHEIQRIIMPLTSVFDVIGGVSPWKNTGLSGKHLERAAVEFDPTSGSPYISLQFSGEGGDLFGELTERLVGTQMAIFLDGEPISVPVVQQAIYGGQATITGQFTLDEAKILAQRLNAGALPVPIDLLSQQTVGPTLGFISLEKSVQAALWGFLLIALFMIFVYRLPGLIATTALVLYAFLNLAAYKFFGVTITLAGIAGFVLSLGIAVDANVLILERLKEEYASGRDLRSAMDEAFKRAWTAIRDGNLTTLIAAAILFWFSSSFIKGFALTLSIGVILSMFTAIVVTRIFMRNVFEVKAFQKDSLVGVKRQQ